MRQLTIDGLWVAAFVFAAGAAAVQAPADLPVSVICVEAETGMVLIEEHADLQRPPASMLKMMQMLLVEEGAQAGRWGYDAPIQVSSLAQSMGGTQVFLETGETWTLERLMEAIAVASANDASVAVAEGLWGSVEACLEAMNQRAQELGMTNTKFYSVNGLPPGDNASFDLTSARDMATLGRALLAYPKVLTWTSMSELQFRPEDAVRKSTNKLLETMPGCDGLKTGYIRAAGFCLTATAMRSDVRLIAVVMGSDKTGRFTHTQQVLEEGFAMVRRIGPVRAGTPIGKPVAVAHGLTSTLELIARDTIETVVRVEDLPRLALEVTAPTALDAPVNAHEEVGKVRLVLAEQVLGESPLVTAAAVERKGLKHRIGAWVGLNTQ